ncbi:hypothetical protein DLM86_23265 [Paenibacillus flagellatus]|uniref:Uncharacterized protein n=1 Tax=Paenibacillus flagellatus TaxID=2211139 RepID=A0A2V5JZU5_9BACL|nr:hypothetical protein DLM86_23265 [Paenibacillus flagellatus]
MSNEEAANGDETDPPLDYIQQKRFEPNDSKTVEAIRLERFQWERPLWSGRSESIGMKSNSRPGTPGKRL